MNQNEVTRHFDKISGKYDYYKSINSYYYGSLIKYVKTQITTKHASILDFGCGTGTVLSEINPKRGVGFDLSCEMIKIARSKYKTKNLKFTCKQSEVNIKEFNYILMLDVIEHVSKLSSVFGFLRKANKGTTLIVSHVSSTWQPILMALEFFNLKMPEGPHKRVRTSSVINTARSFGFELKAKEVGFPFPFEIIVFER